MGWVAEAFFRCSRDGRYVDPNIRYRDTFKLISVPLQPRNATLGRPVNEACRIQRIKPFLDRSAGKSMPFHDFARNSPVTIHFGWVDAPPRLPTIALANSGAREGDGLKTSALIILIPEMILYVLRIMRCKGSIPCVNRAGAVEENDIVNRRPSVGRSMRVSPLPDNFA